MTLATVEQFTKNHPRGIPFTTCNLRDSDEFTGVHQIHHVCNRRHLVYATPGLRLGETRGKLISILSLVKMVNVVNCFALMAFAFTKRHLSFGELGEQ
jgi:hypothetical protein